jgi:hypothetical protein
LQEIAGGATEHLKQLDVDSLGEAMVALTRDPERRVHLSSIGLQRAGVFSWNRAARETLDVYRRAARQATPTRARTDAAPAFAEMGINAGSSPQTALGEPQRPWAP